MANSDKNEKALLFGLFAIAFVILLFFSRYFLIEKKGGSENSKRTEQNEIKKLPSLSNSELSKMILEKKPLVILDIRDQKSYEIEHIIGSKNVSSTNLQDILFSTDKNKVYVIVDYTGENSAINLSDNIKELPDVFSLEGGFTAWKLNHNSTISAGDPSSFSDQSKVIYINSDDLKKIIDSGQSNTYIIDVRSSNLFSQGHLKNAKNIHLDSLENNYRNIPLGKKIIVYDDNGYNAFQAAVRLFDLGVMNVFSLSDGLDTWKQKRFEVVK